MSSVELFGDDDLDGASGKSFFLQALESGRKLICFEKISIKCILVVEIAAKYMVVKKKLPVIQIQQYFDFTDNLKAAGNLVCYTPQEQMALVLFDTK